MAADAIRELCEVLAPGDARLPARMVKAKAADRWHTLVDALKRRGRLLDFDWKHPADDMLAQLARLPGWPRALRPAPAKLGIADADTLQAIEILGRELGRKGVALVHVNTYGDSYPLTLLSAGAAAQAVAAARRARGRLYIFTGDGLEEATAERNKRERAADRERDRNRKNFVRQDGRTLRGRSVSLGPRYYWVTEYTFGRWDATHEKTYHNFESRTEKQAAFKKEVAATLRAGWREVGYTEFCNYELAAQSELQRSRRGSTARKR